MRTNTELIAYLREKCAGMTKGILRTGWQGGQCHLDHDHGGPECVHDPYCVHGPYWVEEDRYIRFIDGRSFVHGDDFGLILGAEDAAAIVALVNNHEELFRLAEIGARAEELVEEHGPCEIVGGLMRGCSLLSDLRETIAAVKAAGGK